MSLQGALARARAATDRVLFDDPTVVETVTITRDQQMRGDDILDEATGRLLPAAGDTDPIYTGAALVAPASTRTEPTIEGAAGAYPDAYQLSLPSDAPVVKVGDQVTVTTSPDDALTGRRFTVDTVNGTGRHVTRRALLHATVPGPRR